MNQQHRIIELFVQQFGRPPEWLSAAPGRVNLIGEHVDYCGGLVLPMAIDRSTMIAAAIGTGGQKPGFARISSTAFQDRVDIPLDGSLRPNSKSGAHDWADYVRGVIAGFEARSGRLPAFDALIDSSVPVGGGLSSSAALEVAMATLLAGMTGDPITSVELALLCQRAEHEFAGVPCGIMDQFAVTFGTAGNALLLDCRSRSMRHVPLAAEAVQVLVINSGVRHSLADGEYARRRAECQSAARLLGVASLRDVGPPEWHARAPSLPDVERRRSMHVVTEHERTLAFVNALEARDWQAAGECMYGSHASLRDDYEVSCPELDEIVEISRQIDGVFGCRLTGGGFGGCAVALVDAGKTGRIQAEVCTRYRDRTGIAPIIFATRAAPGVALLP